MARTAFVTRFDFRVPGADPATRQEVFARSLEQARYVDEHRHVGLVVSEHHGSADGYLPSPLLMASAFAAVTRRIPITVSALLVNLYPPVRLAEDLAVLDHLSGGRVSHVIGLGYRRSEYEQMGVDWQTRGADIESRILLLQSLWTGEPTEVDGRTVTVTPTPFTRPHPFLFYGGGTPAAARRAGRLGLGFAPQNASSELRSSYEAAAREAGHEPGFVLAPSPGPATVFAAEDPAEFWERYGSHLLADAQGYRAWAREEAAEAAARGATAPNRAAFVADDSDTVEEMMTKGVYVVLTPEEMIDRAQAGELPLVASHPACGGLPAEPSWASLRLISETVMPALRSTRT